jgi:hypothetical protein
MWKQGSDWDIRVDTVIRYYADRPYLKFGPRKLNKAFPVLDTLCAQGEALRAELMQVHGLVIRRCDDNPKQRDDGDPRQGKRTSLVAKQRRLVYELLSDKWRLRYTYLHRLPRICRGLEG